MVGIASAKRDGVWFSYAVSENGKLIACAFSDRSRREAENGIKRSLSKKATRGLRRHVDGAVLRTMINFYQGRGRHTDLGGLDLSSVSSFRMDVYKFLCKIPIGKVTTYGAIARKLGGKRYARAVGTAVATNPLPLIIPCHRVVPSSLRVGNYGMCGRDPATGGYMKRSILEREGVSFRGEKVSERSTWTPK
jgi:methylated-DNA-[protein]-cysteine S-methyltransferase